MCVCSRYLVQSTMYDLLVVLSPTRGCGRWEHGMVTHYDKKYVIRSDVHNISHLYDYTLSSHILQMYTMNHTYMITIYYPIYYRCKILFDYYPYYIIQTSKVLIVWLFFHILWSSGGKEARYTWTAGGTWASPKGDRPRLVNLHGNLNKTIWGGRFYSLWNIVPEKIPSQKESSVPTMIFSGCTWRWFLKVVDDLMGKRIKSFDTFSPQ